MASNEVPLTEHREFMEDLGKQFQKELKPYVDLMAMGIGRATKLIDAAIKSPSETSGDILRAVVVLNHAYLEDLLRTVASVFLPVADEGTLDAVPLAGLGNRGRAEKFYLGKLTRHRGKTIDELIEESVSEYLERLSFNNMTEIISFLEGLGLSLPEKEGWDSDSGIEWPEIETPDKRGNLAKLDKMIQRRHHIVHSADKDNTGGGLLAIDPHEVFDWMKITLMFMAIVARAILVKRHPPDEVARSYDANVGITRGIEGDRSTSK